MPRGGKRPGAGRKRKAPLPDALIEAAEKADLQTYAQLFAREAVDQLVKLGRRAKTPPGARVIAWREILDRGHGRPMQGHEHGGKDGKPIQIQVITRYPHAAHA